VVLFEFAACPANVLIAACLILTPESAALPSVRGSALHLRVRPLDP